MFLSSVTQSLRFLAEEQKLFTVLVRGIESSHPIHCRIKYHLRGALFLRKLQQSHKVELNLCHDFGDGNRLQNLTA